MTWKLGTPASWKVVTARRRAFGMAHRRQAPSRYLQARQAGVKRMAGVPKASGLLEFFAGPRLFLHSSS